MRRRRDEQAWSEWETMRQHAVGLVEGVPTLVTVVGARQRARSGMKAYISFAGSPGVLAAWFPGRWPPVRGHLVVCGHLWDDVQATHDREVVFWVDRVAAGASDTVVRRWRRHQRRLDRAERKHVRSTARSA